MHLLLKTAKHSKIRTASLVPDDAQYNDLTGQWLLNDEMLAKLSEPRQTKKADVETGEDQKGE